MSTAAFKMGQRAFHNGIKCAPALDADFLKALEGRQLGNSETPKDMKDWMSGWTKENLAAPVPGI